MPLPHDIAADVMRVLTHIQTFGKMPTVACDECGVAYSTFDRYTTIIPELAQLRKDAEDRLYDLMAEALPHIHEHHVYGSTDPKLANVISGNIKWLLARRRQGKYGDKTTVEHQLTADKEVLMALQAAKARAHGAAPAQPANTLVDSGIDTLILDATGVMRVETPEEREARELAALY